MSRKVSYMLFFFFSTDPKLDSAKRSQKSVKLLAVLYDFVWVKVFIIKSPTSKALLPLFAALLKASLSSLKNTYLFGLFGSLNAKARNHFLLKWLILKNFSKVSEI